MINKFEEIKAKGRELLLNKNYDQALETYLELVKIINDDD